MQARAGGAAAPALRRLHNGIEHFLITDFIIPAAGAAAASALPIMWGQVSANAEAFAHVTRDGNVLYLVGHVEFLRYPAARFPVTPDGAWLMVRYDRPFNGILWPIADTILSHERNF